MASNGLWCKVPPERSPQFVLDLAFLEICPKPPSPRVQAVMAGVSPQNCFTLVLFARGIFSDFFNDNSVCFSSCHILNEFLGRQGCPVGQGPCASPTIGNCHQLVIKTCAPHLGANHHTVDIFPAVSISGNPGFFLITIHVPFFVSREKAALFGDQSNFGGQ